MSVIFIVQLIVFVLILWPRGFDFLAICTLFRIQVKPGLQSVCAACLISPCLTFSRQRLVRRAGTLTNQQQAAHSVLSVRHKASVCVPATSL